MSHLTTDLFNSLYRKHYEQLFYYAYGFTDDAEVCRDILADVFESLWTHRKKITQETAHSYNHGKTKSARIQKRNVFSTDKNEMWIKKAPKQQVWVLF